MSAAGRLLQRPAARCLLPAAGLVALLALWPVLRDPAPRAPAAGVRSVAAPATPRPSRTPPADFGPEAAAGHHRRPHHRRHHRRHHRPRPRPHHPAPPAAPAPAPAPRPPAAPAPAPAAPAPVAPPAAGEFFAG